MQKKAQGTESVLLQIFYTTLGIVVFLSSIQIIHVFLNLDESGNSEIATNTAQTISNFFEHSTLNSDQSIQECFTVLKFQNLENFQYSEDNKDEIYNLLISENGIYKFSQDETPYFKNTNSASDFGQGQQYIKNNGQELHLDKSKMITKFSNAPINLIQDETKESGLFGTDASLNLLITTLGKGSTEIIAHKKIKYIILTPLIKGLVGNFISENKNSYQITIINTNNNIEETFKSTYFIIDYRTKSLFAAKSKDTAIHAKSNLCKYRQFREYIKTKDFKKNLGRNINPHTYNIKFTPLLDETQLEYNFKWDGKPNCFKNNNEISCETLLYSYPNQFRDEQDLDFRNYQDFIDLIELFMQYDIRDSFSQGNLKWEIDYSGITEKDLEKRKNQKIFNDAFTLLNREYEYKNIEELETKINKFYDIDNWDILNKETLNDCNENICDQVYFIGDKVAFFSKKTSSGRYKFVTFDEDNIRKKIVNPNKEGIERNEYYLNGQLIPTSSFQKHNQDGMTFYVIHEVSMFEDNKGLQLKDIVLSSSQVGYIKLIGE